MDPCTTADPPEPRPQLTEPVMPYSRQELEDMALLDLARYAPEHLRRVEYPLEQINAAERRQAARENREPKEWTL